MDLLGTSGRGNKEADGAINSNMGGIRTYVGSDGKLHFVDAGGADTALNFSAGNYRITVNFTLSCYVENQGTSSVTSQMVIIIQKGVITSNTLSNTTATKTYGNGSAYMSYSRASLAISSVNITKL